MERVVPPGDPSPSFPESPSRHRRRNGQMLRAQVAPLLFLFRLGMISMWNLSQASLPGRAGDMF